MFQRIDGDGQGAEGRRRKCSVAPSRAGSAAVRLLAIRAGEDLEGAFDDQPDGVVLDRFAVEGLPVVVEQLNGSGLQVKADTTAGLPRPASVRTGHLRLVCDATISCESEGPAGVHEESEPQAEPVGVVLAADREFARIPSVEEEPPVPPPEISEETELGFGGRSDGLAVEVDGKGHPHGHPLGGGVAVRVARREACADGDEDQEAQGEDDHAAVHGDLLSAYQLRCSRFN